MMGEASSSATVFLRNRWPSLENDVLSQRVRLLCSAYTREKKRRGRSSVDGVGYRLNPNRHEPIVLSNVEERSSRATQAIPLSLE
jgi:hypothetical protein